jgi:hypothetical protein
VTDLRRKEQRKSVMSTQISVTVHSEAQAHFHFQSSLDKALIGERFAELHATEVKKASEFFTT